MSSFLSYRQEFCEKITRFHDLSWSHYRTRERSIRAPPLLEPPLRTEPRFESNTGVACIWSIIPSGNDDHMQHEQSIKGRVGWKVDLLRSLHEVVPPVSGLYNYSVYNFKQEQEVREECSEMLLTTHALLQ